MNKAMTPSPQAMQANNATGRDDAEETTAQLPLPATVPAAMATTKRTTRARAQAKSVDFDLPALLAEEDEQEEEDTLLSDAMAHRPLPTTTISMDDTFLRELLADSGSSSPIDAPALRRQVRRSQSCDVQNRPRRFDTSEGRYRLKIGYTDEGVRERCERNTQQLLQTALADGGDVASSNSAILARKALRYRKLLQRMEDENVDVSDPSFDLGECLGVRWQRVTTRATSE